MISLSIPMQNNQGEYSMEVVKVPAPYSMETMNSDFVQFFKTTPKLRNNYGQVDRRSSLAKFKFIKKGDVYHATGSMQSLQAASLYYHMYQLKQKMDQLEVPLDNEFWPRSVVLTGGKTNNASYHFVYDVYILGNYTLKDNPAAFNANVIMHEVFHSVFHNLYIQDKFRNRNDGVSNRDAEILELDDSSKVDDLILSHKRISSFDEALSDVFSVLITGNSEVLLHFYGYEEIGDYRDYKVNQGDSLPHSKIVRGKGDGNAMGIKENYENAAYFAVKFLKEAKKLVGLTSDLHVEDIPENKRDEMLKILIDFVRSEVNPFRIGPNLLNSTETDLNEMLDSYFAKKAKLKSNQEVDKKGEI